MTALLPKRLTDALKVDGASAIRLAAELIATEMQLLHGGDWQVRVDHETCYVTIRQK